MYIVVSLLSITAIMHSMQDAINKGSAGNYLNNTLDIFVGKETAMSGTITTVENELGIIADQAKEEITLLGVTPNRVYEIGVVCGALYLTKEGIQYVYNRYFPAQAEPLDEHTQALGQSAIGAHKNADILGQFVSTQQINSIVESKWQELMKSGNLADKEYVETIKKQVINALTQSIQTTASRVEVLETQVQGLKTILRGDPKATTPGIVTAHDLLVNRVSALENQQSSSSSSTTHSTEQGGGMMSKLFRTKKTRDESGVHGVHGEKHSQGDIPSHDDDNQDGTTTVTLHTLAKGNDKL
jgi:hypothetical protein